MTPIFAKVVCYHKYDQEMKYNSPFLLHQHQFQMMRSWHISAWEYSASSKYNFLWQEVGKTIWIRHWLCLELHSRNRVFLKDVNE